MTTGLICPNGHPSDESDYCSVCGAPMTGAAAPPPPVPTAAAAPAVSSTDKCPNCGTPRADATARYCEVCRYDYQAQEPGPPPVVVESAAPAAAPPSVPASASPAAAAAPAPAPAPPPLVAGPTGRAEWEVTIALDPTLDAEPDPDVKPPPDIGDRIFPIDLPEMLVGRRDDAHNIRPEIPVIDPGVSRRHAHLLRLPEGRIAIVDLASANGTAVNGSGLIAGQRRELADGDVVTIGRWTRITVHRRL
jgi:hypothetical protein